MNRVDVSKRCQDAGPARYELVRPRLAAGRERHAPRQVGGHPETAPAQEASGPHKDQPERDRGNSAVGEAPGGHVHRARERDAPETSGEESAVQRETPEGGAPDPREVSGVERAGDDEIEDARAHDTGRQRESVDGERPAPRQATPRGDEGAAREGGHPCEHAERAV